MKDHLHTIEYLHSPAAPETYRCGSFSATGRTDALRSLLRQMVAAGLKGSARVRDTAARHCLTIRDIGSASAWTLSEEDARGFVLRRFSAARAEGIAALRRARQGAAPLHLQGAA